MSRDTLIALVRANTSTGGPLVPASTHVEQETEHLCTLYPNGRPGVFFQTVRVLEDYAASPPRAVYVFRGAKAVLDIVRARIASDGLAWTRTWDSFAELIADNRAAAVAVKNAWRDDRPRDENGNPIGARVALRLIVAGVDDVE